MCGSYLSLSLPIPSLWVEEASPMKSLATAEYIRLVESAQRSHHWKRWGPYLPERQWGTVREDYSPDGSCWEYLPYELSRSRVYRWGEDGLLGWCDRKCRLCFSLAVWNGNDGHLKEKLFGLTGPQGNHGEDVKELYYYLKALPTYAFAEAAYVYPVNAYPYHVLQEEAARRSRYDSEYEIFDVPGLFDQGYFDIRVRYAKGAPNDTLIEVVVKNVSTSTQSLHVIPSLWYRNTWSWGRAGEAFGPEPLLQFEGHDSAVARHATLGNYRFAFDSSVCPGDFLWTNNETNFQKLFHEAGPTDHVKDAFHRYLVDGDEGAISLEGKGTKLGVHSMLQLAPDQEQTLRYRLTKETESLGEKFGEEFQNTFSSREEECRQFYQSIIRPETSAEDRLIAEQAYSGLLWSKQFYYYSVYEWMKGDPSQPKPADERKDRRNREWKHLYNMDIISVPDKWEYPWYAAWDLAFHTLGYARVDPDFAKEQLLLLLREWYMHPNGQIPAYEFAFSDVNPPVHAWACWRVYKMTGARDRRDRQFLERVFHKLLINFTWWVNRKDVRGNNLFTGGFLGLDNIGVFDRSGPAPLDGHLEQSDATAWMAFYCGTMLSMALELAKEERAYSDIASKFFEHFVMITDSMNTLGGSGLWDEDDGFYYDQLHVQDGAHPLKIRSLVGLIPLIAVEILDDRIVDALPGFKKRLEWFLKHRSDLAKHITYLEHAGPEHYGKRLLAMPSRDRLERILDYLLNEDEFLSPYGIRSLSRYHYDHPYTFDLIMEHEKSTSADVERKHLEVSYTPGESNSLMFGGNSNWRGPVWLPTNYLIIEALEKYHHFYGDSFQVEFPKGSGRTLNLLQVSRELSRRLIALFQEDESGKRPYMGDVAHPVLSGSEQRSRLLFHEYFHGDNGKGLGAAHQTGWTALVALLIEKVSKAEGEEVRGLVGEQLSLR